jgi:hypothetical protein
MPTPRLGEKQSEYLRRAIHVIGQEEPGSELKYRVAKAYGMWRQWKKKHGGGSAVKKEG